MKPSCPQSAKFLKLKRRLKLTHWQCVGLLESIWLLTQHSAKRGDIGRLSNEDIAASIEWDGDADALIRDLLEVGFLDTSDEHRLLIHDWSEHCPTWIKGGLAKSGDKLIEHVDSSEPKVVAKVAPKVVAKLEAKVAPIGSSTSPVLTSPSQSNPIQPLAQTPQAACECDCAEADDDLPRLTTETKGFDDFWACYPRKVGKGSARKAFARATRIVTPEAIIEAASAMSARVIAVHCDAEFIPHAATWLNRCGWEDDLASAFPERQRNGHSAKQKTAEPEQKPETYWKPVPPIVDSPCRVAANKAWAAAKAAGKTDDEAFVEMTNAKNAVLAAERVS